MSPSKVRESRAPSQPDVTVELAASRGADCAGECCRNRRIGALGSRRSHHCLAISGGPRWSSVRFRLPGFQRSRGHPRVRFALLQSWSCPRRPVHSRSRAPSMGSGSSSRRRSGESTWRRASQARLRSARSVSHALDGLLLTRSCRFVSLCCHVQDFAPGLSPRPSRTTSSVAVALAPLAPRLCRRLPDDAKPRRVDLRAFTPGRDPVLVPERLSPMASPCPIAFSPSDSSCRPCPGGEPRLHPRPCRPPLECCVRWSWRFDRPTASMLYL